MIDQFFQRLAEKIHGVMLPQLKQLISELMTNNIFEKMSTEELQIGCIKIALEALALIIVITISRKLCAKPRKSARKTTAKQSQTGKNFKPKEWSPTGWVWNEVEGIWEAPDYIIKESNERWQYDRSKGIWIDLSKEK